MTGQATTATAVSFSSSPSPSSSTSLVGPAPELQEQFDEDGNAVKVGNLTFVEGTLGQGAYGTVRLARRTLTPPQSRSSTPDHGIGSSSKATTTTTTIPTSTSSDHRKRMRKQSQQRRTTFTRSASAPTGSSFFQQPSESQEASEAPQPRVVEKSASSIVELLASPFKGGNKENGQQQQEDNANNDSDLVAVKIFNKSLLKRMRTMERDKTTNKMHVKTAYENVEREIALMKKLSHPNLVALYDVIDSPESDNLYMVLEYMPLGEILTYQDDGSFARRPAPTAHEEIDGVVHGHFDEAHAALFFVDILHALGYLHQHHICHRDLKPENILLDARGVVKISDFGVSHFFEGEQNIGAMRRLSDAPHHHPTQLTRMDTDSTLQMTGLANVGLLTKTEGTWCFWSPEMCSSSSYFSGYASDMWAAGVCLYIFVTGKLPFFSEVPTELFDMIAQANVPYKGLGLSNSLVDLLEMCLEKDPTKRAGVGDCLRHPFLQVARNTRIRQLSAEFAQSRRLSTAVEDDDIRKAFRIVTTMVNPAVLLKNAQKHIQEGFQSARDRLSMGGSTFSSSSSLVGSDEEKPAAKSCGKVRSGWTTQAKKISFQQVGASLDSFESTTSESSGNHPSSSGKLFPIPQGRVMTESTRALDLQHELEDAAELNISLTERTSNMSGDSVEHAPAVEHAPEDLSSRKSAEQARNAVNAVEKRASAEIVEEDAPFGSTGSPKRLRKKDSKEQCTIQ